MKHKRFIIASLITLAFAACKKDDSSPSNNGGGGSNTAGFTWKEDGGAENRADSAFWTTYSGGAGIRAYKGGMANFFEINVANSNVGSQALGTGLTYLKGSAVITSKVGTLNITANASDKLSGDGITTVSGGGLGSISFTFTDLPKR